VSEDPRAASAERLVSSWLRNLPLSPGGYAESLLPTWVEDADARGERSSLAQLRLAYTFLHAAERGLAGAEASGRAALERANEIFWREDLRGWMRSADREGRPLDATVDTYDQAFGLLALSWDRSSESRGGKASEAASRRALDALAGLDEAADPSGGYRETRNGERASKLVPYPGLRRQNPHMHLLEAFLSWWRIDPEGPWRERAAAIVELLRARFLDHVTGALREYFDDSWRPAAGEPGRLLEPGHHFEWVWLLNEYRKASGDGTVAREAESLYGFAQRYGVDGDGLAFDAVDASGKIVAGTKLLWPQTEQLKARLAMYEWKGDGTALAKARRLLSLISSSYLGAGEGPFFNRLDREGRPLPVPTPSRVLYHVFLALVEADRVIGKSGERGSRP
jgi:mannose/cellobiose epimerase-like protein (N-acyl-D-glucosamine 2-epimerase family)